MTMILLSFITSCKKADSDPSEKEPTAEIGQIIDASVKSDSYWIQEHSVIVKGTLNEVWKLCTDDSQMKTHMAPIIKVDFRNGGRWEASYDLKANIGDSANFINEIVNIIPYRSYTTKGVRAPFDMSALESLRSTMSFEDLGESMVKVTATTTGWERIKDVDYRNKVFEMSGSTNPEILKCLNARISTGPLNWTEILGQGN